MLSCGRQDTDAGSRSGENLYFSFKVDKGEGKLECGSVFSAGCSWLVQSVKLAAARSCFLLVDKDIESNTASHSILLTCWQKQHTFILSLHIKEDELEH